MPACWRPGLVVPEEYGTIAVEKMHRMSVIQRLTTIARPYRGNLYQGLVLGFIGVFIETGVISALVASIVTLITGHSDTGKAGGLSALPMLNHPSITSVLDSAQHWLNALTRMVIVPGSKYEAEMQTLVFLALITGVVVFVKCVLQGRSHYLMHRFANQMARDVRQRLFTHLTRLSPSYFEVESTGAQLTRVTGDVVVLQNCMGPQLAQVLQAPWTIIVSLLIMFFINWRLMVAILLIAPIIGVMMNFAGKRIRLLAVTMQVRLADLNAALVERLANIRVIQSFVREPYEIARVAKLNAHYYRETMRSVLVTETLAPGVEFVAWMGMIIGAIFGGYEVLNGRMAPEPFVMFILLAQKAGSQFKTLSRVNQLRQQAIGAGERIFSTLDTVPDIQNHPDAVTLPPVAGLVEFDHVAFNYRSDAPVLRDITFTAHPGEIIALVGKSGSGKTTLVNLLQRFYDVAEGEIRIDGVPITRVTLDSLREQVGNVPQETVLFSGTIHENILYGKLDASEAEVQEAARAANALEFIEALPQGFHSLVGERGTRLSGGQRQRIAIARALLKNPRILILDEATSALDTESEQLVQQALDRLMQNRTTFVIAHRLSTVRNATRLYVLDNGRIVESGAHEELLALRGHYARLYERQFRDATDVPSPA